MKHFIPYLLGLTFICFSFTLDYGASCESLDDKILTTPIELCQFSPGNGVNPTQCPGMPAGLTIADDCTGSSMATLLVTNLQSNPVYGQTYPLPGGQPPIYYEYSNNGPVTVIGPITSLTYLGQTMKVGSTIYPLFEHALPMTFDCFDNCSAGDPFLFFEAKVTYANGELYEVSNYANHDQIFYSAVFEISPPEWLIQACSESCGGCGTQKMTKEENIYLSSAQTYSLENEMNEEASSELNPETNIPFSFDVSPNPFTDDINIHFSSAVGSEVSIVIIDVSGKTIIKNNNLKIVDNSLRINSRNLETGLYYCTIISDNQVSTKKLIKN